MQTYGQTDVEYGWWSGNSRFSDYSGQFLAAHNGQIASMCFWAGSFTLFEVSRFNPDLPVYQQNLVCIPQLARAGWGVAAGGAVVDTYPYFAIAMIHLVAAAILGAGALYGVTKGPKVLADSEFSGAQRFHFEWDDFETQGRILGHHLLFLGAACLLFATWACTHGVYDPVAGEVRAISPSLNIVRFFKYGWATPGFNPYFVNNLEDVIGGHFFVSSLYIAGGIWHILVKPWPYTDKIYVKSGEALLAYALAGLAFAGFNAAYFCSVNDVVFPVELFGPVLEAKLNVTPYFAETLDASDGGHTTRFWISNFHYYWAFYCLQGHLFHALRSYGFDFRRIPRALASLTPQAN